MGKTVEETYKKIDQLEHVLLRPDSYVGSIEHVRQNMWVYDADLDKLVNREIDFIPALFKIFDEIIVNAADNKVRDPTQTMIKVDIDKENNEISIMNNGKGIPVEMHKEHNVYVPELIFGHMMTSSNYDDDEKKVTGGRNGFGAKLCNIFSSQFTVETAHKKKKFKMTWTGNMSDKKPAKIGTLSGDDYTKITFRPDLKRFRVDCLSDDMVSLFRKRAYDIAGTTAGLKVFLDGKRISFSAKNPFKDYCEMYTKGLMLDSGAPVSVLYDKPDNKEAKGRWEVGFAVSCEGFQNVSFANSIATTKGGRHVDAVMDQLCKKFEDTVNKKNKGGLKVKAHQIKQHCWIFVNAQIENPSFDSQTKENMTLIKSKHGSKPELSDKFIKSIEKSGVIDNILNFMKFKQSAGNKKMSGTKTANVVIAKLDDATEAGKKNSKSCTLILTEGDSAKTAALAGISSLPDGKKYYGVFPLRGKLLNAREATHKQLTDNKEIKNIIKAMGFDFKRKYDQSDDLDKLRYGKLMIMTDQDVDGSHIKGLVLNFLHNFWPNMLRTPIVQEFITPIVKVTPKRNRKESRNFYSLPEFNKWYAEVPNPNAWEIKYYKGLGTSTAIEFKEYFSELTRHRIPFRYGGTECDDKIKLGFQRDRVEDRKTWLTAYMEDLAQRQQNNEDELTLYDREQIPYITYQDFIDKELVLFSYESLQRAIPNAIDGFKPGQRKVLYVCFVRNDKREVKVAQLSGSVAEKSAYHHGEVSLQATIIKLAQDFVGSNNINLLLPNGQFGSRRKGGADHAASRYIFTKLSPLARKIYPEVDDNLYEYVVDDNQRVEPKFYAPIIPMALVNGSAGIGTGWATKIPNHCPRELAKNVLRMIDGQEPIDLVPKYRNYRGEIIEIEKTKCVTFGEVAVLDDDTLEVTELPIGKWTEDYADTCKKWLGGKDPEDPKKENPSLIEAFEDYSSDSRIKFIIKLTSAQMKTARAQGYHHYLGLTSAMSYTNSMTLFDEFNRLQVYNSTKAIMKNHFQVRSGFYVKRHKYLIGKWEAECAFITNKARFVLENIEKKISVMNKKKKVLIDELFKAKYESDPIKAWKRKQRRERGLSAVDADDQDGDGSDGEEVDSAKDYQYLLGMPIYSLTLEQKEKLLKEKGKVEQQLKDLKKKTPNELWQTDIAEFLETLDKFEADMAKMSADADEKVAAKTKKGKKRGGKNVLAVDPSADGDRVEPLVTDKMKKDAAPKVKREPKAKKETVKKEPKVKKEVKKEAKDTSPKEKKTKKGKNAWETDSDDDDNSDDAMSADGFISETNWDTSETESWDEPVKQKASTKRSRKMDSSEEDTSEQIKPAKKKAMKQGSIMAAFGKTATKKKKVSSEEEEEDTMDSPVKVTKKKPTVTKKKKVLISDSDNDVDSDVPPIKLTSKKATASKAKKVASSEDEASDKDSDDDDFVPLAKKTTTGRAGRGAAKKTAKYNFSSSDED